MKYTYPICKHTKEMDDRRYKSKKAEGSLPKLCKECNIEKTKQKFFI